MITNPTTTFNPFPSRRARRTLHTACWLLLGAATLAPARGESVLAYAKGREIYTASAADGKDPHKVCRGDDPCISNDGRYLAYTRSTDAPAKARRAGSTRAIVVRELAGGKEVVLPVEGAEQVYGARWSPDDQWVAFNIYNGKAWAVAVAHPDGTGFHRLTDKLDTKAEGYYLAGWNLHDGGVLTQNLTTMAQVDPASGDVTWQRPVKDLTGEDGASSDMHCTISASGKLLVSTRYAEDDEFKNLDGPSSYLVLTDLPDGKPRRVTPPKFDAAMPWMDLAGESILLRGFSEKDVTTTKGDGIKLKTRIYRYDIRSGEMKPVTKDGESPSASRG